jgi:hypothetical protein
MAAENKDKVTKKRALGDEEDIPSSVDGATTAPPLAFHNMMPPMQPAFGQGPPPHFGQMPYPPTHYPPPFGHPQSTGHSQERWDNMASMFNNIRETARSFEYPPPSVAALETVLLRLYLETPVANNGSQYGHPPMGVGFVPPGHAQHHQVEQHLTDGEGSEEG